MSGLHEYLVWCVPMQVNGLQEDPRAYLAVHTCCLRFGSEIFRPPVPLRSLLPRHSPGHSPVGSPVGCPVGVLQTDTRSVNFAAPVSVYESFL